MKKNIITQTVARFIAFLTRRGARLLTGARSLWVGCEPELKQRIYYANHNSHIDFILLWSSLPIHIRRQTRPIAASDYWLKDGFRRFLIQDTFSGVTIQRNRSDQQDPLQPVKDVLTEGYSIIFFPEGTRNLNDDIELLEFKSGLYHLSQQFPDVEVVPVWISNLKRVMPKGAFIPLPLLSTVIFGKPLVLNQFSDKEQFLKHAQQQLLKLKEAENQ
ncbi:MULTISPECIES: lysophospholipid acyltransferase family protein [Acinetobacter]|jgi:1-acyl-sn-glycerol-3-phosphate acyltransferase|uniref:1-acyl-sn-glycerol-3-phosphate acyltransferase n=1 Tax=Acinetobacter courvalinii TaxID=280147 RepID=A0AA42I649_9GAMM|nr:MULTISPECIES: lysophospholipid acyltransferase family protein [Acinetobacter]EXB27441.1 acyltransferase family protein [Acinetobacter baumannii 1437282]MBJ8417367.1 1-acyl-sn-glycerol-3-phosphate acyltransferase [Acinetobacter courvalinii]MBJ9955597.1 1-acyl-sn-glycerol-3-phosphate acyltransferase [Acinetobacter courvalinii]MCU4367045.1 1-acyl-sn-glycerol-3-phosphate acyltransferase [Acinetobacter courvalinii]MCU4445250.1 1-acyl-sn-glycerol-3-phosphate acyltransferase [Acinetobacter courval